MSTYLDRIACSVRRRLEERKRHVPISALQAAPRREHPAFAEAVQQQGVSLIAEIKRASPSKGPLRPSLDVADLALRYQVAGARAVSILTEQDHFLGRLQDVREAAQAVALPVLQKDFILEEYQVFEAASLGASAVLLIVSLLTDREMVALGYAVQEVGLDVLVEVHDELELERALAFPHVVIGINNRNLHSFEVTLETAFRLVSLVPPGTPVVSESGVRGPDDIRRLWEASVDGMLVGEHILTREDVGEAVSELVHAVPGLPSSGARSARETAIDRRRLS